MSQLFTALTLRGKLILAGAVILIVSALFVTIYAEDISNEVSSWFLPADVELEVKDIRCDSSVEVCVLQFVSESECYLESSSPVTSIDSCKTEEMYRVCMEKYSKDCISKVR